MFKIRYKPQIGDVVSYKGKRMVIINLEFLGRNGHYAVHLLDESLIKAFQDFTETKDVLAKCIIERYDIFSRFLPFTKVDSLSIDIQQISYTKICFKK